MAGRDWGGPVESRLISLVVSVFFSIPTAAFLWLVINQRLFSWGGFLNSDYLIACILVFAAMAFLFPQLFPSILGRVWRGIFFIIRWFGW